MRRGSAAQTPPLGSLVANKYRLEAVIGSGGMGTVLRARAVESEEQVAVKFVKVAPRTPIDAAERLLREARAAQRIQSPHVVRIHELGFLEDASPFIVMEYLEGETLAARLRDSGPFAIGAACHLLAEACRGVAAAHCHGVVHRDLKPQNLFACRLAGGREQLKVLDFGLVKSLPDRGLPHDETTSQSVLLGSPAYMSPEQIRFRAQLDQRTDIWSLGVVCYELITGQLPFAGSWSGEIFASVLGDLPRPMAEARAGVPLELERTVARCLRKDPGERFPDASQLADVLQDIAQASGSSPSATLADPASAPARPSASAATLATVVARKVSDD